MNLAVSVNKPPPDAKNVIVHGLTFSLSKEASCLGRVNKAVVLLRLVVSFLPHGRTPAVAVVGCLREGLQSLVLLGVKRERKG